MGYLFDPVFISECLFTSSLRNLKSLKLFDNEDCMSIRLYQLPYMSYEYLIVEDPELTENQNFDNLKGCGDGYFYTGRKTGKSLIALLVDLLLDTAFHFEDWVTLLSSFDETHLSNVAEPYITVMEQHPFFRMFEPKVKRKPITVELPTGHLLQCINMNLSDKKKAGSQFESQHASKIVIDEHQYETEEVVKKRSQAISELGCIYRFAGITSFTKMSPAGVIFTNLEKRNWLVNIPETISPAWNEKRKQEAIEDFGNEDTFAYRIHILAELIEDAEGLYEIEKIRQCYYPHNKKKPIKHFKITREDLPFFKDTLVVERPPNAEICFIAMDYGDKISEVIIIFAVPRQDEESLFKYVYNITLSLMTPDEQFIVIDFLIKKLQAELTGVDCTDGGGRDLWRSLLDKYTNKNIVRVHFSEKVAVDFEKDNEGKIIYEGGQPKYVEEFIVDWSVRRIRTIFYNKKIDCLYDLKLDKEFNNMIQSKKVRVSYGSKIGQDHLHQAFQVWSIMEWVKKFMIKQKPKVDTADWGKGAFAK